MGAQPDGSETGAGDGGSDASDASHVTPDARPDSGCTRVAVGAFALENADDVSARYVSPLTPRVGSTMSRLEVLFERYVPGPVIGRFELGAGGSDANYGGCTHCVAIPGTLPDFAYFADRGVLDIRADPYTRRLRATIENLRLVEVSVNPETRESTPVADGRCIEIDTITVDQAFPGMGWTCPTERFADTTQCDCACGALDPDCITCDPSDPTCPAPLPVRDCAATDVCRQGIAATTRCYATCTWGTTPCTTGQCIFDNGVYGAEVCAMGEDEVASARVGETCATRAFQRPCNVVDGFARGYCDAAGICRPTCERNEDCVSVPGTICQPFFTTRTFGYCEVPPMSE